jgi:hypothetical protein
MHPTRIFQTPLELENAFEKYKESLKLESNQWLKVQYVGKEGDRVTDPQKVPYTLEGFKRYCRKHYGEVQHYFDNTDKYYDEFCVICRAIREEIREDQIIGGLLGFYNPSITQRLNGLTDKSEMTVKEQPLFPDEK